MCCALGAVNDSVVAAGAPDRKIMITAAMLDAGIDACEDWNEDRMRSDVPMCFAYLCDAVYKAMTNAKTCARGRAKASKDQLVSQLDRRSHRQKR
jgi:hypothetical protein